MTAEEWRAMLERLRAETIAETDIGKEGTETVMLDQSSVGRLSRMDALQAQAMSNATQARRKARLLRIDAALERLDDDEFGYCLKCGEEIAEKRLKADPTTLTCINCT